MKLENQAQEENLKRKSTQPSTSHSSKRPKNHQNEDRLLELCVNEIINHGRPFSLFNDAPMKEILSLARNSASNSSFKTINDINLRNEVELKAAQERCVLKNLMKQKLVSVQLDFASYHNRSFYGKIF